MIYSSLVFLLLASLCSASSWRAKCLREAVESDNYDKSALVSFPDDFVSLTICANHGKGRISRCLYESLGLEYVSSNEHLYNELISSLILAPPPPPPPASSTSEDEIVLLRVRDLYVAAERAFALKYKFKKAVAMLFLYRAKEIVESLNSDNENVRQLQSDVKDFSLFLLFHMVRTNKPKPEHPQMSHLQGLRRQQSDQSLADYGRLVEIFEIILMDCKEKYEFAKNVFRSNPFNQYNHIKCSHFYIDFIGIFSRHYYV